jgi:prenylcysteine oxidase/farnesylcysteine lyase
VDSFLKYYDSFETRPVFETVDEMLKWAGLYNLTTRNLQEELIDVGLSPLLIQELVTVRTWTLFLLKCFWKHDKMIWYMTYGT